MHQALPALKPPGALCVAPTGYGKSKQLRQWHETLQHGGQNSIFLSASALDKFCFQNYLAVLSQQAEQPLTNRHDVLQWLQHQSEPLWWFQDDGETVLTAPEITELWQHLLKNPPQNVSFVLAFEALPALDLSQWLVEGAHVYQRSDFCWSLKTSQAYWQGLDLPWTAEDQTFWEACRGWPVALLLHTKVRLGEISSAQCLQVLTRRLQDRQRTPAYWTQAPSELWQRLQKEAEKENPHYWLHQALQSEDLSQRRAYLYRAAGLSDEPAHQLKVLTHLAHQYLQAGQWKDCDRLLSQAEPLLKAATELHPQDQAAWLYLRANRARQQAHYAEAHHFLDQLQNLRGRHVTRFQTRAVQLRGLTYYQQGQYHQTESLYQQALALAHHDSNTAMQLEIQSMLYFLQALQDHQQSTDAPAVLALVEQVQKLPLTRQPLIYLNLVFAQLLGERIDVTLAQTLITQAKQIAETLNWDSLWPLIWDVEARLWRFLKQEDRALRLHAQALERLEPNSFAALYAQLNQALSLLRQTPPDSAYPLLQHILHQAQENGSQGLVREAEALLPVSASKAQPSSSTRRVLATTSAELRIQTFGGFQVFLQDKPVGRWPRKKSRHILVQLLLHSHSIHRETLADWLTGQDDLEQALRSLDVHIHALRKVLEPQRKGKQTSQYIHFQDACYRFNRQSHYQWDAENFSDGYDYWLKHKAEPEALDTVEKTLAFYQGTFLPELDFADLWQAEREHYQRQGRELTLWCARQWQARREPEQARAYLTRWLQFEPTCDAVFAQLFEQALSAQDLRQLEAWGEQMEQTFIEAGELIPSGLKQQYQTAYQRLS